MTDSTQDPVAVALPGIAARLEAAELQSVGGDMRSLRERHLSAAVHAELGRQLKTTVVSTVIAVPDWPSLGRSAADFAVDWPPRTRRFRHVGELKWCQVGQDKVYEVIWDLFKMALMLRIATVRTAHLITGAPREMWPTALCADVFDGGEFDVAELCQRRFRRGSRGTAWDWLLDGGHDRFPERVPSRISTHPVADRIDVEGPGGTWQLRAVRVEIDAGQADVRFEGGWPEGHRPADARRPAPSTPP